MCTSPPQQNYNGYAPPPQPGYGYQSSPQPYGFNGGVRTTYLTPAPRTHPRLTKPHDIVSHRIPWLTVLVFHSPPRRSSMATTRRPRASTADQVSSTLASEHTGTRPLGHIPL